MSYLRTKLPESLPVETVRGFSADLTGLIAWLSTQDPATKYFFFHGGECLFGRFHKAIGVPTGHFCDRADFDLNKMYPGGLAIACEDPHTFGAALERARSALRP